MLPGPGPARARSKRALLATLIVGGTILGTLATASPSTAAPATASGNPALLSASAAKIPAGATRTGLLPASQTLAVEVTLNVRNQPELNALLAGLADQGSPYYHHYLTPAQFDAAFSPSTAQVQAVEGALRAAGLTPGQASGDHLSIPVTATAAQLDHAFAITLATYRLRGGRVAYASTAAPSIPSAVAPLVQGVIGLNDLAQYTAPMPRATPDTPAAPGTVRSLAKVLKLTPAESALGPTACAAAASVPDSNTPNVFAPFYGMDQEYALGDYGQGQKVALLELESNSTSDVTAFKNCFGLTDTVNYIKVDGGAGTGPGSGEAALDIDVLAALAPKATIDVYQGPNSSGSGQGTGIYDIFHKYVTSDAEKIMSVSWGECDAAESGADQNANELLFQKAYAQGQTILAAAGDNGSTSCSSDSSPDPTVSANEPAGSPYVTSVGGTGVRNNPNGAGQIQVVWNDSDFGSGGAGGGGLTDWCMPSYQYQTKITGLVGGAASAKNSACAKSNPGSYIREAPDVSADADPLTGYTIYYDGSWQGGIGGTSAATPLWAAFAALVNASPYCSGYGSGAPGVLPGPLYAAVAAHNAAVFQTNGTLFDDIVTTSEYPNDNDYTPSGYTGGLYPVTTGYDMATGIGTPEIHFANPSATTFTYAVMMCQQTRTKPLKVTSVSPSSGKANTAVKVTIHGTGFVGVPGGDKVRVYSGSTLLATLTASCTPTACTVTLPKESARTVDLRVSVLGSASSPLAAADRYTYANAPHITSIAPSSGTHNGGTKVTIRGTSFIGVHSVTFNGRAGTKIAVSGTTSLTVVAPSGPKGTRVKVVITAAGGTSNTVLYLYT
jgi:subtilase family serine protease